ncbi:MAG TPA: S1 family peptidase [Firmicutes bacterium]|nr:hypothetical protein [Bacillota bacterium]HHY98744.1 S1 family peptidase [Bacillota bacterium]
MDEIQQALAANKDRLLKIENVVGVGRGLKRVKGQRTKEEAIVVMVRRKMTRDKLHPTNVVPEAIDGVRTDVLEVGDIKFLGRQSRMRPAQPGISIGHYRVTAGTFGALVKDKKTGKPLILSNNHVLANSTTGNDGRAKIGDPILQPGPYDGGKLERDQIATLERLVPIYTSEDVPTCEIASLFQKILEYRIQQIRPNYRILLLRQTGRANLVDAALAKPISDDVVVPEIMEIGNIRGVGEAQVDMYVKKSGRTTGVNSSQIEALDATIQVGYGNSHVAMFEDQVVCGPIAQGGDSGSAILDKDNNIIGLLFAGSDKVTVFNRIQNVMKLLDITI